MRHQQLFLPPLPAEKIAAIEALGVGIVDKIYVHFEAAEGSEALKQAEPQLKKLRQAVPTPVTSFRKVSKHMASDRAAPLQAPASASTGSDASLHDGEASINAAPIHDDAAELASPHAEAIDGQSGSGNSSPAKAQSAKPSSSPDQAKSDVRRLQPVVSYHLLWHNNNQYAQSAASTDTRGERNAANAHEESGACSSNGQVLADSATTPSTAAGMPSWVKGLCNLRFGGSEFIKEAAVAAPSASLVREVSA